MIKMIFKILLGLVVITVLYFLFWPVGFEAAAYTPPNDPGMQGDFAPNEKLQAAEFLLKGIGIGPESIAFGPDSMFYTGYENGDVVQFSADGKTHQIIANTGGRPLGLQFHQNGDLIVADEIKGLLAIDSTGEIKLLSDEVEGTKINFADDFDIDENGVIYFTDASQRNHDIVREVWELQATGRLISYHPTTKETKIELPDMRFANGVAIGPNGDYVLVTETFGLVINKFWLKGDKKGQKEVWVDELPGFPDNITYNGNGTFWLAIPNLRLGKDFENLYDKPFLRKMIARLPKSITEGPQPTPYGVVIGFDLDGNVTHNFQDTTGNLNNLTSALEIDGYLYIGSLQMDRISKLELR